MRDHLIKGAVGSFGIQVGFAGLTFFSTLILARILGAVGYGAFANAMAWVNLLGVPATFGFGTLLVREVPIYRSRREWEAIKGLLNFSNRFVLILSLLLVVIFEIVAGFFFSTPEKRTLRMTVWIALPMVPIFSLLNLRECTNRGLEHVFRARLPSMIIRPALLLTGIFGVYLFREDRLSAPVAMAVNMGGSIVALLAGTLWLREVLPSEVNKAQPEYRTKVWLRAAFPMLVYSGMQIIMGQTDIVMLGALRNSEEVGLYVASNRLSYLLMYVIVAAEMITAPIIANLNAKGEKEQLQKILTGSARIAFLSVLPFGLILIFWGGNILIIFGAEFIAARAVLSILALGRLLDVSLGSSALVLSMTGNERIVAILFGVMSLVNVGLNGALIPLYGPEGAAIATIISLVAVKLMLGTCAVKNAGQHVTVLGKWPSPPFLQNARKKV